MQIHEKVFLASENDLLECNFSVKLKYNYKKNQVSHIMNKLLISLDT